MMQFIGDKLVSVVEFDTMPALPITGEGWEKPYAKALTEAIVTKIITEPGKYGIHIDFNKNDWTTYKIIE